MSTRDSPPPPTHTHKHVRWTDRQGCEKDGLETVTEEVRLEGGFKRGRRIRVAECLRQSFPNRWASVRKRSFAKCFCVYTRVYKGSYVGWIVIVLLGYRVEGYRTDKLKWGDAPEMELKQIVEILYWMRCVIGIHCRVSRIGWMWSDYLALPQALLLHYER